MTSYFDNLETQSPSQREESLFAGLPSFLAGAMSKAEGLREWLAGHDPMAVTSREALARLPVLRKPELMQMQAAKPPFGGLADPDALVGNHVFMSPGPVWEPQGFGADPWQSARSLFAAGLRSGDIVHNTFSYHMTPGAFVLDEGARALGCLVFPAGIGNTEAQVEAAAALKPTAYTGTPDYLKVLLDKAEETGCDISSIKRAMVSGGALFPSLREEYRNRGIVVMQSYATADIGVIAYESADDEGNPHPGMIVNENLIVEIVRPGTGDPVADGEVGEIVVTSLNPAYPLIRFGTGDMTAVLEGASPCGRTGTRIQGWMGRADQRTKIKGMFVDPKQVAAIVDRHADVARARLVVRREGDQDAMTLHIEPVPGAEPNPSALTQTLADVTKLKGDVILADNGLPNDGKVISDERNYDA
ncbi:phenylacetate--CoA ligase family protein [Hoeflea prorocentri]|uniref:AMP-binding protein n=1 Tax=Hoeflea prorocentri TaxID=1922333 RepID=A0A9X3ZFV1_9HYPH|nr:AMP-binding protein [Hoeflea prorocentri]MCY6379257.1 AMP-binding protein [Hoeflea prorocentri]MDA5397058.1 AMP-binding protein [Hoeflea prorocentri]